MAITSGQTTVGTVATYLTGADSNPAYVHIHNNDNTKTAFIGGASVGTANGLSLLKEDSLDFYLHPGNALYAITSSGTHVISWLRQSV